MTNTSTPLTPYPTGRKNVQMQVGGYDREQYDFYPTPVALIRPLLRLEKFEGGIWEPACGDGAMSRELSTVSHKVVSTDLIDRSYGDSGRDFLKEQTLRAPNIATNPPFRLWEKFARHAHRLGATKTVLFHRLVILGNKTHSKVMKECGLARVWIARGRFNILPPGAEDKGHNSRHGNYAWFVFERGYEGPMRFDYFAPSADRDESGARPC